MSTPSMLKFRASIFAVVLTLVPMSPALHAQDADMAAQVNVPFAFNTASQHYAPGLYRLRMENEDTLLIEGASNSHLALVRTEDDAQRVKTGKAVFHKYGNQYFLSGVRASGSTMSCHLAPSKQEKWAKAQTQEATLRVNNDVLIALN